MLKELLNIIKENNIEDIPFPGILKKRFNTYNFKDTAIKTIEYILTNPEYSFLKYFDHIILQLFLNHFTAYKGYEGSILKTIISLPFIKEAGFNSIMLLPHFLRSNNFKKGDRGSPYSVKDYYTIDPDLNEFKDIIDTELLFKAFIEASHRLGILVFIDMVPRTAARDSNWILENPDWFYWIKLEDSELLVDLLNTHIPSLPSPITPDKTNIKAILNGLPVKKIASLFSHSPKYLYPERWENFVKQNKNKKDFLDNLINEFGIIPPPCTSDCVNDPQPPWDDVTPLRLYEDYDDEFYNVLGNAFFAKRPPFFIQPILKASIFKGKRPMHDLWEKIAKIPKYYKESFGINGLRGDMFHALPDELIQKIVKDLDDDFVLIMENLNNESGELLSKKHGFDYYTGNLFTILPEGRDSLNYFINEVSFYKTKILAMPVVGDSPPLLSFGLKKAKLYIALSAFLPNSAYGVTADTLIGNFLPLNFGLGFSKEKQETFIRLMNENGRKLAYFNKDFLNKEWDNPNMDFFNFIKDVITIRKNIYKDYKLLRVENIKNDCIMWEFSTKVGIFRAVSNFSNDFCLRYHIKSKKDIILKMEFSENSLMPYGFLLLKGD